MGNNKVGKTILNKRKAIGLTQQELADKLQLSFQAVSKWENGMAYPDIELLPKLANILGTTVDALLGYSSMSATQYEERYKTGGYYWGLNPNRLCYEIMKLKPPIKPYRVLDIGCGEGKDAVFFAKNGYIVTAFDIAEAGIEKARELSERNGVHIDFFKANVMDYRPDSDFDIIFSSGVFHYVPPETRKDLVNALKSHTKEGGINAINVFVEKPFLKQPPDSEISEYKVKWHSGELFTYYHDWLFHKNDEEIFDCNSGGIPHKHCMDILIAEKLSIKDNY
jgi:transcriptional regulator with XRE-family HTH domain